MSGWIILGFGVASMLLDFAVGLWLFRRDEPRHGLELEAPPSRRIGRLIMFAAPLFLMVFALIAFGTIPIEGIEPIELGGGA